jgi:hypothetical protein
MYIIPKMSLLTRGERILMFSIDLVDSNYFIFSGVYKQLLLIMTQNQWPELAEYLSKNPLDEKQTEQLEFFLSFMRRNNLLGTDPQPVTLTAAVDFKTIFNSGSSSPDEMEEKTFEPGQDEIPSEKEVFVFAHFY